MAQITEHDFKLDLEELKSGLACHGLLLEPRSPGLHHSDVIRDLENILIKPGQRVADIELSEQELAQLNVYRELGFMWEIVLEAIFKKRRIDGLDSSLYLKQVEIEHDQMFKTIDARRISDGRILEYKLTFKSMKRAQLDRFEQEFWNWFTQLKSNCLAWDTRIASLFVFWINGTYSPPVPTTKRYDIVFDDEELLDNWNMLLNHRKTMQRQGRVKYDKKRKLWLLTNPEETRG